VRRPRISHKAKEATTRHAHSNHHFILTILPENRLPGKPQSRSGRPVERHPLL